LLVTVHDAEEILAILDRCSDSFTFPMLDNGYVYLAATRMSLFRSRSDWAIVVEVFGFSPRASVPRVSVQTYASRLHDRDPASRYVNETAHTNYLTHHPHDEIRSFEPIAHGPWLDEEFVADDPGLVLHVRDREVPLPDRSDYRKQEIELSEPERILVFELCRYVAAIARESVLATHDERRVSILPEMQQLIVLDEWHHPDLVDHERPSQVETFQQLALVLATGDTRHYQPTTPPNTHWQNWPDGGSL
jgi:hypothetical protein